MAVQTGGPYCEVDAATGSDLNGGWFNSAATSAGTDYTYGAGQTVINYTDLVVDTTTNTQVTSVTRAFIAADVRNYIRIPSGVTGFTAGVYEITAVASGKATLSNSPGATSVAQTNGTIKLGGSLATVTQAVADWVANANVWVKYNATPYNVPAAIALKGGGGGLRGYTTTRGDRSTRPTLVATNTSITMFSAPAANDNVIENLILDGNSLSSVRGINVGQASGKYNNLRWRRWTNSAIFGGSSGAGGFGNIIFIANEIDGCTGAVIPIIGTNGMTLLGCDIHNNTGTMAAAIHSDGAVLEGCNSYANTGHGFWSSNNNGSTFINCSAYGNSGSGFIGAGSNPVICYNCISYGNTLWQFEFNNTGLPSTGFTMFNCATGTGGSGGVHSSLSYNNFGTVTLTADPFVASGSGNFALNTTAGGGALVRGTGLPQTFPAGTTTSTPDIGSAQHADPVGGASQTAFAYVGG